MNLPPAEKSVYLRGLLILVGRDRVIDPREREIMLQIGAALDFDKRFCEAAMDDLPRNPHIKNDPVIFSQTAIAERFLNDAIRLALVDHRIHPHELAWLKKVGHANGVPDEWIDAAIGRYSTQSRIAAR